MKNKGFQRILIFFVLIVWGLIIFRVFNYIKKDEPVIADLHSKNKQNNKQNTLDSLSLLVNYSDPFKLSAFINLNTNNKIKPTLRKKVIENQILPIPKIIYKGAIYNQIKHKYVGIIIHNQISLLLNEGDSIQSWKIAKIYKDSLLISTPNQRTCINISK